MRKLLFLFLILLASPADGLPGATPAASCEEFFASEIARGGEIKSRHELGREEFWVLLRNTFEGRETMGRFTCYHGTISRQFLTVKFPTEKTAIHWFHLFRDELARRIGKPYFDGTNPEQLRLYEKNAELLALEDIAADFRYYALWSSERLQWSIGVASAKNGWVVTLRFDLVPAA